MQVDVEGIAVDRHQRAADLLKEARQAIAEAFNLVPGDKDVAWDRDQWEAVFGELVQLDTAYDELLRTFGRRFLSTVTGRRVSAAREAILTYLRYKLGTPVTKEELRVIAGIDEWARRVRELRVEHGWPIIAVPGINSTYRLTDIRPDPAAKARWRNLNRIRNMKDISGQDRMLHLLRQRMGQPVHVEELDYVANDRAWKEHLLRLRSEHGFRLSAPVDRPELEDEYLLESDSELPDEYEWDIPEEVRGRVLQADDRRCTACGWEQDSTDDRWLEVHRRTPGSDLKDFVALCSVCHNDFHSPGGEKRVRIRVTRNASVRAADWEAYFTKMVPSAVGAQAAGTIIQSLLLPSVRIAGRELPHIREINSLRENTLWHERVSRVVPVLKKRFGAVWAEKIGLALKPPLQGRSGDGLEQLLKYLIREITGRPAETTVRLHSIFPGRQFKDAKEIDLYVPTGSGTAAFLSLKWSLRGDRSHQVHLEAANLKAASKDSFFAVVTNEYDVSRLTPLLDDRNIDAVYHVDLEGVRAMWEPEQDGYEQLKALKDITELFMKIGTAAD